MIVRSVNQCFPLSLIEPVLFNRSDPRLPGICSFGPTCWMPAPRAAGRGLGLGMLWGSQFLENAISECECISWVDCEDLQFIEFFSGFARTSLCMKTAGLRTAKCDYKYHYGGGNNYYDILTPAGFASLTQPFMSNWHHSLKILKHFVLSIYTAALA